MAASSSTDPRIVRTRIAVFDAINELLAEGGWEAVTHQTVAERSGYARSTIYRHWPERTDLLLAVMARAEESSHAPTTTGDLRADLLADITAYRTVLFDRGGGATLTAVLGVAEHADDVRQAHAAMVERGERVVRGLLADAAAAGDLRADLDPVVAASELFGPVTHRRLMTGTRPTDDELGALVDGLLDRHGTR